MAEPHYSADDLLGYLDGNDAVVDAKAVDDHLRNCAPCTELLRQVEKDYELFTEPTTWVEEPRPEFAESRRPRGLEAFIAAKERLAMEVLRAEETYEELRAHPLETWIEHLTGSGSECTDSLVRLIVRGARAIEERDPREALRLLDTAEAIGMLLPAEEFSTEARGELWKERANTHMVLGAYPAALEAWDEAERAFGSRPVAAFDLAFVAWGRASVYFEMGQYARALPLVRAARQTLRAFGDRENVVRTGVLEACIVQEQGDLDAAEALYAALHRTLEVSGDELTFARVLANIACCRLGRDDVDSATAYAKRAMAIYERHGLTTEVIRTRWALARTLLQRGKVVAGVEALQSVAGEFEARGLTTDAAEVRLDIVEELLRREDYAGAATLVRTLVGAFLEADAQLSVVRALTYLREASAKHRATPQLLRAVRHVLAHPEQPFAPPN